MVWNTRFEPDKMQYGEGYEETQAYSAAFREFQYAFANRLFTDYQLADKTVLEIGCGKGEFLAQLAELGIARGIGFDPSIDPARLPEHRNLEFHAANYPPQGDQLDASTKIDCYVCKMTLEHVANPGRLIKAINQAVQEQANDALIAIQVPSLERILSECAYWDIYYEHCNYFSLDSLSALLELNSFEVLEASLIFEQQYLNVVARAKPTAARLGNTLANQVQHFIAQHRIDIDNWRELLIPAASEKSLLIWGAASKAVALINAIPELKNNTTLVDINPNKQGTFLPSSGLQIESPDALKHRFFKLIVVANPVYLDEVVSKLKSLGVSGQVVYLGQTLPRKLN